MFQLFFFFLFNFFALCILVYTKHEIRKRKKEIPTVFFVYSADRKRLFT